MPEAATTVSVGCSVHVLVGDGVGVGDVEVAAVRSADEEPPGDATITTTTATTAMSRTVASEYHRLR
jgi:hypothetical protein